MGNLRKRGEIYEENRRLSSWQEAAYSLSGNISKMKQLEKQTSGMRSPNNVRSLSQKSAGSNPPGWKGSGQSCASSWGQGSEGRVWKCPLSKGEREWELPGPHPEPAAQAWGSLSWHCHKKGIHMNEHSCIFCFMLLFLLCCLPWFFTSCFTS